MDILTIAKTAVQFVFPFIAKNKAVQQITEDITKSSNTSLLELWEWLKPIFIEEFEKEGKLEEDAENEAIIAREVKKKVQKADDAELTKLKTLLAQLQSDEAQGKLPKTNTIHSIGNRNFIFQDVQGRDFKLNTKDEEPETK